MEDLSWSVQYSFSESEFFRQDIDAASFEVSKRPGDGMMWNDVIAVRRFFLDEEQSSVADHLANTSLQQNAVGNETRLARSKDTWQGKYTMMKGVVKRHVGTDTKVILDSKKEGTRVRALREIFGIAVDDEDVEYIEGRDSALPSTG